MIYDTLPVFTAYLSIHRLFPVVSEFISSHDVTSLEVGRHPIGRNITVIIDTYSTRPPQGRPLECHRKFIDIQVMLSGIETIGFAPASRCVTVTPYDEEKDYEHICGTMDFLSLRENDFAIFFPHDAHLPGTTVNDVSGDVKKMVIKVPV